MHFDNDINQKKRTRARAHGSRRHEKICDGDDLATVSRSKRHWYDETELDAEEGGYEWLASNSRANLARRRVERYLDQMKLHDALEDALDDDFDDDWSSTRRGRKRRHARRNRLDDAR